MKSRRPFLDKGWTYDIEDGCIKRQGIRKPPNVSHDTMRLMCLLSVSCCVLSLSLDPLFFYIPLVDRQQNCIDLDKKIGIIASALRSALDMLYVGHILFQCYVTEYRALVSQHFRTGFEYAFRDSTVLKHSLYLIVDIVAIIPLPQLVTAYSLPNVSMTKNALKWIIFCQYVFRFWRIYPLYQQMKKTSGTFFENARAGATLNLLLYMLASHLVGSLWYFFSVERVNTCWSDACHVVPHCNLNDLYCDRRRRRNNMFLDAACPLIDGGLNHAVQNTTNSFDFGIFIDAIKSGILERRNFKQKFLYCFWWSLRSLSSLGQGLNTSSFEFEICFAISIAILGLILFALIISNVQNYLQSSNVRVEEMRVRKQDREWWMSHRKLPEKLRERIRRYEQYKWQETRGLVEDSMFHSLPKYLRIDVKCYIGIKFLSRVPIFRNIDERFLRAICAHMRPILYTGGSLILSEGDPVDEMLFIVRGTLESVTISEGRANFYKSTLVEGDFCGEELLTWILDPTSSVRRPPLSTSTVTALSEVELFALVGDDLKSLVSQNPLFYNHQIKHGVRYYSHQWRCWAACYIQAAWRRHRKWKLESKQMGTGAGI